MNIQENYPLINLTTFHIGGSADFFVSVESLEILREVLTWAGQKHLPVLTLGKGSNILVSDSGFKGLVIHNQIKQLKIEDTGEVLIGAGENWDDVVLKAVVMNLAGIECLSGVPGSAGGALVQNIGAYGQTLADVMTKVYTVEAGTGAERIFSPEECEFEYRGSLFKKNPNKYIITGFEVKLHPNGTPTISYPDLTKHFEGKNKPSLSEVRNQIIQIRSDKGYLIMPGHEGFNTAGSFFKNPIVTPEKFESLRPLFGDAGLNRHWIVPNGVKLAAAFLMQEAGFSKGYREGNVGISPKHSLSIVNFGGATAAEVKSFAEKIKAQVSEKFGVSLEEEIIYVGKF